MYIADTAKTMGGSLTRNPSHKYHVFLWYIPGGYDYTNAEIVEVFFEDEENAKAFEKHFEMVPEMAHMHKL